jgi:UDP-glucose 4-epimerase
MKRVAVVGGGGRLGRYVVDELMADWDVRVLDLNGSAAGPGTVATDITKLNELRASFVGVDAVIHVAGIDGHVDATPESFFAVNVMGTWNVLQAASECGIRKLIVTSSTSATGLNDAPYHHFPAYLPIDEEHPLAPASAYGIGKQLNEVTAVGFSRNAQAHIVCIRPTYIVFPDLVSHLAGNHPVDDGELRPAYREPRPLLRTYVDPRDLARCYRKALEYESTGFDLFWASAADTFEAMPTLDYLRSIYGKLPPIRKPGIYENDPHASVIDCSRAKELLNWTPEFRWDQPVSEAGKRSG